MVARQADSSKGSAVVAARPWARARRWSPTARAASQARCLALEVSCSASRRGGWAQSASGSSARKGPRPSRVSARSAAARARAGSPARRAVASAVSRSASSRSTSTRGPATNRRPWRSPATSAGPAAASAECAACGWPARRPGPPGRRRPRRGPPAPAHGGWPAGSCTDSGDQPARWPGRRPDRPGAFSRPPRSLRWRTGPPTASSRRPAPAPRAAGPRRRGRGGRSARPRRR
jgi:hypothetical protein